MHRLLPKADWNEEAVRHNLRHRFGYRMAMSVSLHQLAQLMGYASLDTTMVYVQRTRSNFQSAVNKMIAWTEKEWNCWEE